MDSAVCRSAMTGEATRHGGADRRPGVVLGVELL